METDHVALIDILPSIFYPLGILTFHPSLQLAMILT